MGAVTPDTYVLGPGKLKIGPTGTLEDYSGQFIGAKLTPSKKKDDDIPVLSGATLPGDATYEYKLSVNIFQDLGAVKSLVEYSYTHKGEVQDFVYIPSTVAAKQISGKIQVDPIEIGGDEMKKRPQSSVDFDLIGDPVIGPIAP